MAQSSTSTNNPITSIDDSRFQNAITEYCNDISLTINQFASCVADFFGSDHTPITFSKLSDAHVRYLSKTHESTLTSYVGTNSISKDGILLLHPEWNNPKRKTGTVTKRLIAIYNLETLAKKGNVYTSYEIDGVIYNLTDPLPSLKIIMDVPMEIVPEPAPIPVPIDIDAEVQRCRDMAVAVKKLYAFYECLCEDSTTITQLIAAADEAGITREQMMEFHEQNMITKDYMKTFYEKYFTGITVCYYGKIGSSVPASLLAKDFLKIFSGCSLKIHNGNILEFRTSTSSDDQNLKLAAIPTVFLNSDFNPKLLSDEQKINSYWYDGVLGLNSFVFLRALLENGYHVCAAQYVVVHALSTSIELTIELFNSRFCGKVFEHMPDYKYFVTNFVHELSTPTEYDPSDIMLKHKIDTHISFLKHIKTANPTIFQSIVERLRDYVLYPLYVEFFGAENIRPHINRVKNIIKHIIEYKKFYDDGDTASTIFHNLVYCASLKTAENKYLIPRAVFTPILLKIIRKHCLKGLKWYIENIDNQYEYSVTSFDVYDALRQGIQEKIYLDQKSVDFIKEFSRVCGVKPANPYTVSTFMYNELDVRRNFVLSE
jgi:hypothetical protein